MHLRLRELYRRLALWRFENGLVAEDASTASMQRILRIGPVLVLLYAINTVSYGRKWLQTPDSAIELWAQYLTLLFGGAFAFAVVIVAISYTTRRVERAAWHPWFVSFVALLGLLVTTVLVAINQRITPSTSPFTLACMAVAAGLYLRPLTSAGVFLLGASTFYLAMGWAQPDPNLLLTNRLNGIGSCAIGWALSSLFFRNFATIHLQRHQLQKANAELCAQQETLKQMAAKDGLTGLYNRATFVMLAEHELKGAQRQGSATAILLVDLDHFKRINDTWGHPVGDAVLRQVAALACGIVRSTDVVGRLGGEEFIILLPAANKDAAYLLAQKLREKLQNTPVMWQGTSIAVTASIGVAGTDAIENLGFDVLYAQADKALYVAKQQGRNQVV